MKIISLAALLSWPCWAAAALTTPAEDRPATAESTAPQEAPKAASSMASRFFYGGHVGFAYTGDYTELHVAPLVGFQITTYWSAGVQPAYHYLYDRGYSKNSTHGFGGGVFTRYSLPIPALRQVGSDIFIHAEYECMYFKKNFKQENRSETHTQNSLLVGAGMYIPLGGRMRFSVAALWNVLNLDGEYAATPTVRAGFTF